jgi:hypothetical protein
LRYDAIGSVSAVYDEKYNYKAFVVFEEDGGRNISTYTNLYALAPLVTNKVYFVAEIPAEAMEGNVELIVNYGGEKYYIIV